MLIKSSGIERHPILERGKKKNTEAKRKQEINTRGGGRRRRIGGKEEGEEEQAKGKITRTSENDHIGKVSASVCWQGEQQQPDP